MTVSKFIASILTWVTIGIKFILRLKASSWLLFLTMVSRELTSSTACNTAGYTSESHIRVTELRFMHGTNAMNVTLQVMERSSGQAAVVRCGMSP